MSGVPVDVAAGAYRRVVPPNAAHGVERERPTGGCDAVGNAGQMRDGPSAWRPGCDHQPTKSVVDTLAAGTSTRD